MNSRTFQAFGEELTKIAFLKTIRNGFTQAVKDGWHGTKAQQAAGMGQTWFGKGRQIKPGMSNNARRLEELTSLGGLTRLMPVGNKAMMAMGTAMMAREAIRPDDPTGQQRSVPERVSALAGDTIGGLAGAGLAARLAPGSNLIAPLVGTMAGSHFGRKVTTAPWAHKHQQPEQQPQEQMPQQMPYQGVR